MENLSLNKIIIIIFGIVLKKFNVVRQSVLPKDCLCCHVYLVFFHAHNKEMLT